MKRGSSGWLTGLVASAVACAWSLPVAAAPLRLSAEPERVSIAGLTPGSRVAVIGVVRTITGLIPGFDRLELLVEDEDGDGRVEIALEEAADPEWSQWIAVDLGSGEWAIAGRSDLAEPSRPLGAGPELAAGTSVWPVSEGIVEVLVVRPGEGEGAGAWAGEVWDGGSADGDGLGDGQAGVSPALLQPVGASGPAPERYAAGDILIAITPRALRYGITRVVEGDEEVTK